MKDAMSREALLETAFLTACCKTHFEPNFVTLFQLVKIQSRPKEPFSMGCYEGGGSAGHAFLVLCWATRGLMPTSRWTRQEAGWFGEDRIVQAAHHPRGLISPLAEFCW